MATGSILSLLSGNTAIADADLFYHSDESEVASGDRSKKATAADIRLYMLNGPSVQGNMTVSGNVTVSGTFTVKGDITPQGNVIVSGNITGPALEGYSETVALGTFATGAGGLNLTCDCSAANIFAVNVASATGNIDQVKFTNPATGGRSTAITLYVVQGTGTARTIDWFGTSGSEMLWAGGSGNAPTLTTGLSAVDVFTFLTVSGTTNVTGTTWAGFVGGKAFS